MPPRSVALLLIAAVVATSCAGVPGSARSSTRPTAGGAAASAATGASAADVLDLPLTDVRSGERFTLGGFGGKVTFFIAMAVW